MKNYKTLKKLAPKQTEIQNNFYVFDTETKGLDARPESFVFGVIYGHNFVKIIDTVEKFKKELTSERYKGKYIFAHNVEYDLLTIYGNIFNLDNKAIFNNHFITCTNGNCKFADSMNIFHTSVKELGRMIGLEKLEVDYDFKNGYGNKEIEYCVRDCEIVFNSLFYIFNLIGNIKITISSIAMDYFRRNFQLKNINYNDILCNEFFNSYYGGRVECFKLGKINNGYCYDINSMYPYVMLKDFPNPEKLSYAENINVSIFEKHYLKNYEGLIYCELFHVEHFFGFLPFRFNKKLCFPNGNLKGCWNFNEIRFALKNKIIKIKSIEKIVFSEKIKSPFTSFVFKEYEKKNNTEGIERDVHKRIMNSLYGKFGQKIKNSIIYIDDILKNKELIENYEKKGKLINIRMFNSKRNDCYIEVKNNKEIYTNNSIPSFASYITSYARIELLAYILKYKDFNPLYCDTDSIFFEFDPQIKDSNLIGKFKKEKKLITGIYGLKNYSFVENNIEKYKIKGIPENAIKKNNQYTFKNMVHSKESIARNIESGIFVERKKTISGKYEKRIILKKGITKALFIK